MKDKCRVLVVDDETGFCDFISHYLRNRGFEVEIAFRADQALDMVKQRSFDVVLADVMMPAMDGLDMLRRMKEIDPQVIVILMTAYASLDKAVKAIAYGAADLLPKPFVLSQLAQVIHKALDDKNSPKCANDPLSSSETD